MSSPGCFFCFAVTFRVRLAEWHALQADWKTWSRTLGEMLGKPFQMAPTIGLFLVGDLDFAYHGKKTGRNFLRPIGWWLREKH